MLGVLATEEEGVLNRMDQDDELVERIFDELEGGNPDRAKIEALLAQISPEGRAEMGAATTFLIAMMLDSAENGHAA